MPEVSRRRRDQQPGRRCLAMAPILDPSAFERPDGVQALDFAEDPHANPPGERVADELRRIPEDRVDHFGRLGDFDRWGSMNTGGNH